MRPRLVGAGRPGAPAHARPAAAASRARRYSRLAAHEKRGLSLAYAIEVEEGSAGVADPCYQGPYMEMYVHFQGRRWMVTQRFLRTAQRAIECAVSQADRDVLDRPAINYYGGRIIIWLRRIHRRSLAARDGGAVAIKMSPKILEMRGSQAPNSPHLRRHLDFQRRRDRIAAQREALRRLDREYWEC